ncbi:PREDICTED: tetratricopeptide repeat protein 34 isoform X3 [Hipposideros armiger]|uniref:Tetratricopeptide repeat protein 34 isoform X3 n=1 Tax=Hipposideros armiger TaxID=186990 RepID=A0A8B7SNY3_HIPAR|nr:PREDICTED: tetratricopeptide repeat protein 34 isoform X3 [Hipposideros armiger]
MWVSHAFPFPERWTQVPVRTGHGPIRSTGMMSAQELVACLCREGDQHLALGEPPLATAFYLAAFSCHAPSAVRRVRAALAEARGAPVVATLEAWCRGDSQIPAIHWDGMAVVSLTGTLASAFLATLCPDHPAAVLHSLAGLLAHGRHREVAQRCSALLDAHTQQSLELRLTRALAWVLSGAQVDAGLADYVQAFTSSADRTVAFVRTHQQPYLPVLVSTLQDNISRSQQAGDSTSWQETDSQRLLAALDPEGTWSDALSPEALLRGGRYEDCRAACSRALEPDPTGSRPQGERLAALLVTRAAAAFFLDSGAQDLLGDLHQAFRESPSGARRQFEALLSAGDRERVRIQAQEAADVGFAHFQEAVRSRPELREDSGRELLAPVTRALRVLLRVAPPRARPALGTRLAECLLLAGNAAGALALCERLLQPSKSRDRAGNRAPLLALRGFCALHVGDALRAREDFQAVVEQGPPHTSGCVRALCGRGLLRVLAGSTFLGALDYVTACRLRPDEALLVAKAYVPWNQRGLLLTVLREEGRRMLQRKPDPGSKGAQGRRSKAAEMDGPAAQEGDAQGVYQLATLLMELDAEDEAPRLLVADALYRLGRLDEAHKALLVALSQRPQAAPVLARLALLQLRRGFFYDANQLVKKVVQSGDTACLQPTLDVFRNEDRQLLRCHCHTRALAILRARQGGAEGEAHTREAIAYLSLAIFAAGSQASESLLARARCYGLLGQKKTAIFDFNSVLRAEPGNVQALCGRALLRLALDQQEEAVDDIFSALKLDPRAAVPEICSLKPEAQALITQGLSSRCRALLSQRPDTRSPLSDGDVQGLLAVGEALIQINAGQLSWHILLADVLIAVGRYEEAGTRLQKILDPTLQSEAAQARRGLLRLKKGDMPAAARDLQCLAETDAQDLGFLLCLLETSEQQRLSQTAAQEASALLNSGQPCQALGYCSLAVLASGGRARHLRLRAACLTELQEFGRALGDLDHVLQEGTRDCDLQMRAEDLCSRGRLLLSLGDEARAARAFAQALKLAPTPAQNSLWEQPGRAPTTRVFLCHGQRCLDEQCYTEAWTAAESGLLVDPEHGGLKRLKSRIRREATSGCRLH